MTGFTSKKNMAEDKLLPQKDFGDALTIAYQSGYYDGKKAAQPEEKKLHPVSIGVDVTQAGTSVTAFYRKPDAVMEMFYAQFHPMPQPAQDKLDDDDALTIAYQSGFYDGKKAAQPAKGSVAHCEAGPEYCVQCKLEDRSIVLAAAVRYVKNNTPPLVSDEICRALATPPQRPWVGLTNKERSGIEDYCEMIIGKAAFDAIEAKLKEKNT